MSSPSATSTPPSASPPLRVQRILAVLLGFMPLAIGVQGLLNPANHLASMNFPGPTAPSDALVANALMRVTGVRNVFMGASIALGAALGDRKLLSALLLLTVGVVGADASIIRATGVGGEWGHVGILGVLAGLGGWILSG